MRKFIALFMLLFTLPAYAAHVELGVGYARGKIVANGTWRQQGNPYTMKTNNPTWFIGVTGKPYQYLAWHADFVHIGTYSENSWDTSDQSYGSGCRGPHCSGGWYHFIGSGMSQGVRITVGPSVSAGHWHLSLQGGPFFYESSWSVTIYNTCGQQIVTATHMPRVQVGDTVGANLRYRSLELGVDYYLMRAPQDRYPPLIYGAYVATLGYRF